MSDLSMKTGREVLVSIQEIHKPELNAQLQAEKIAARSEATLCRQRGFLHLYRARGQSFEDHHLPLASGYHQRPQGSRDRQAELMLRTSRVRLRSQPPFRLSTWFQYDFACSANIQNFS